MKVRSDFVSNSSSTSFVLIGNDYSDEELISIAKKCGLTGEDASYELEKKFPDLKFFRGLDKFYDRWCVGLHYEDMKIDETRRQFETRVEDLLESMTGSRSKAKYIEEAGYDG